MDLPKLRTSGRAGQKQAAGETALPPAFPVNEIGELVADLIEATGLVPPDRLAPARGRAKQGMPFSTAVLEEGVATPEGIARTLASRFQLPFVDLALVGVQHDAAEKLPLHVLERVNAIPYALERGSIPHRTLPMRFNFPNDPRFDRRYPVELDNILLVHYLRTRLFDRHTLFTDEAQFARFMTAPLKGSNHAFRDAVRRLSGGRYPFREGL